MINDFCHGHVRIAGGLVDNGNEISSSRHGTAMQTYSMLVLLSSALT